MSLWKRWFGGIEARRDEEFKINLAIVAAEAAGFNRGRQWERHVRVCGSTPPETYVEKVQRMEREGLCSPQSAAASIAKMFLKEQP